jgi:hypothetical protein
LSGRKAVAWSRRQRRPLWRARGLEPGFYRQRVRGRCESDILWRSSVFSSISRPFSRVPRLEGPRESGARIVEIGVWRRALMATEDAVGSNRENQAEVDAVLAETGGTMDQVRRWRHEVCCRGMSNRIRWPTAAASFAIPKACALRSEQRMHYSSKRTASTTSDTAFGCMAFWSTINSGGPD